MGGFAVPFMRLRRGAIAVTRKWFTGPEYSASDGSKPAVIADFEKGRYALPALGPELLPFPNFTSSTDYALSQASITNGILTVNSPDGSYAGISIPIPTTPGKMYAVTATIASVTSGGATVAVAGEGYSTPVGTTTWIYTAKQTATTFSLKRNSGATLFTATMFSVKEVLLGEAGPELISDGNFASGASWTLNQPGTSVATISGETLNLTGDGTNPASADHSFPVEAGETYTLIFQSLLNSGSVLIGTAQGGGQIISLSIVAGAWNLHSFVAPSTGTLWLRFARVGTGSATTIDNVSIRRWMPNPVLRDAAFEEIIAFQTANTVERTYIGSDGLEKPDPGANKPRFDHSTGTRGLLIENGAMNILTSGNVHSYARMTLTTGISDPAGGTSARRYTVTGSDPLIQVTLGVSPAGKTYVFTFWMRVVDNPGGNALRARILSYGNTGTEQVHDVDIDISTSWRRYTYIRTFPGGMVSTATNFRVDPFDGNGGGTDSPTVGASVDTFGWDVKEATFATSRVPTSGAAVSRLVETARFTHFVEMLAGRPSLTVNIDAVALDPNLTEKTFVGGLSIDTALIRSSGAANNRIIGILGSGNISQDRPVATSFATRFRAARSGDSQRQEISIDGLAPVGAAATIPSRSPIYLGRRDGVTSQFGDGVYYQFRLYPLRLTSGALQGLSA